MRSRSRKLAPTEQEAADNAEQEYMADRVSCKSADNYNAQRRSFFIARQKKNGKRVIYNFRTHAEFCFTALHIHNITRSRPTILA